MKTFKIGQTYKTSTDSFKVESRTSDSILISHCDQKWRVSIKIHSECGQVVEYAMPISFGHFECISAN